MTHTDFNTTEPDLLSPATRDFIRKHRLDDVRRLALAQYGTEGTDLHAALTQITGWQTARHKLPSWAEKEGIVYPPHLSMEQCSSEPTARYKAQIMEKDRKEGARLTDLTGGFGVDFAFMAPAFAEAYYVERQEMLCRVAAHNFALLGLSHAKVHCGDATDYLKHMQPCDWIFLDPARRDSHGNKTVSISQCEPDASALEPLLLEKGRKILVKLSPMLDLSQAMSELLHVEQAHVVAMQNECKELLLLLARETGTEAQDVPVTCANLTAGLPDTGETQTFTFTRREEQQAACHYTTDIGRYLYEPYATLLKAGAFRCTAERYGVDKLHPNSHLYTSDRLAEDFPGRIFQVTGHTGFGKKQLKGLLEDTDRANVAVRNFPEPAESLRRRLKLRDGGDTYLFATTLADGSKVLVKARKV